MDAESTGEPATNTGEPATDNAEPAQEVERRRSPRIVVSLDAQYRRLGREANPVEATTVDVSHGGARITAPVEVSVGDVLQLTVEMPHGIELTLQGLVVQLTDAAQSHHAHVAFDSLSTAAADLLTDLLDEQAERLERENADSAAAESDD